MTKIPDTDTHALLPGATGYDPIEDRLRQNIRATIETLFEEESEAFIGRCHYGRGGGSKKGCRYGHRDRRLTATFGTGTVRVPRARIEDDAGKISEWRSTRRRPQRPTTTSRPTRPTHPIPGAGRHPRRGEQYAWIRWSRTGGGPSRRLSRHRTARNRPARRCGVSARSQNRRGHGLGNRCERPRAPLLRGNSPNPCLLLRGRCRGRRDVPGRRKSRRYAQRLKGRAQRPGRQCSPYPRLSAAVPRLIAGLPDHRFIQPEQSSRFVCLGSRPDQVRQRLLAAMATAVSKFRARLSWRVAMRRQSSHGLFWVKRFFVRLFIAVDPFAELGCGS